MFDVPTDKPQNQMIFPGFLTKNFQNTIKPDILWLFKEFHEGKPNLARFNYASITLISKCEGANLDSQFSLITWLLF